MPDSYPHSRLWTKRLLLSFQTGLLKLFAFQIVCFDKNKTYVKKWKRKQRRERDTVNGRRTNSEESQKALAERNT